MDAKEYLQQAHRLDLRIKSRIKERQDLMELITSLSSPQYGEKVSTSPSGDPLFLKQLERVWQLDSEIKDEINLLVDLKSQIREAIDGMDNINYQVLLRYRYINHYSIPEIAEIMNSGQSTIKRWHSEALNQMRIPDNPVRI